MTNGIDVMCNYLMRELASEFSFSLSLWLARSEICRSVRHVFKELPVSDRKAVGLKYFTFSPSEWWMSGFPSAAKSHRSDSSVVTVQNYFQCIFFRGRQDWFYPSRQHCRKNNGLERVCKAAGERESTTSRLCSIWYRGWFHFILAVVLFAEIKWTVWNSTGDVPRNILITFKITKQGLYMTFQTASRASGQLHLLIWSPHAYGGFCGETKSAV